MSNVCRDFVFVGAERLAPSRSNASSANIRRSTFRPARSWRPTHLQQLAFASNIFILCFAVLPFSEEGPQLCGVDNFLVAALRVLLAKGFCMFISFARKREQRWPVVVCQGWPFIRWIALWATTASDCKVGQCSSASPFECSSTIARFAQTYWTCNLIEAPVVPSKLSNTGAGFGHPSDSIWLASAPERPTAVSFCHSGGYTFPTNLDGCSARTSRRS